MKGKNRRKRETVTRGQIPDSPNLRFSGSPSFRNPKSEIRIPHSTILVACLNRQRTLRLSASLDPSLRRLALEALFTIGVKDAELAIVLVSDRKIQQLNRDYRRRDKPTDVLSFLYHDESAPAPHRAVHGDVVISVETAARQAREHSLTLTREIEMLGLHGVLHLCGFDHETDQGEMNRLERKLRRELLPLLR